MSTVSREEYAKSPAASRAEMTQGFVRRGSDAVVLRRSQPSQD